MFIFAVSSVRGAASPAWPFVYSSATSRLAVVDMKPNSPPPPNAVDVRDQKALRQLHAGQKAAVRQEKTSIHN